MLHIRDNIYSEREGRDFTANLCINHKDGQTWAVGQVTPLGLPWNEGGGATSALGLFTLWGKRSWVPPTLLEQPG